MNDDHQQLNTFINCFARKIADLYPSNYSDKEDYIQEGHLKLAEINAGDHIKRDFQAYAVTAISRAMREAALVSMCAVSAPKRIKRLVHKAEKLIFEGKTEQEICQALRIDKKTFMSLKALIYTESWHQLFFEPILDSKPFLFIDDILSCYGLTEDEKIFIESQFTDNLNLTRKQRWSVAKGLRSKLSRSGYEV